MGPLSGVRVVELAAIGPVPFACMLLADLGAEVIRIDRTSPEPDPMRRLMGRGRRSIGIDLKREEGQRLILRLIASADVLVEGMRPGVIERLGLAPETLLATNPRLVVGRMTGWGQTGPYAAQAGHDINYLGVVGGLHAIGQEGEPPPPPLNLVADFGGGAMYLVAGVLAALMERQRSGEGQVVEAAMVDGVSSLLTMTHQMMSAGVWSDDRESNLLDGGAPFYRTYTCADGAWLSVGAIEPQFYAELISGLGFSPDELQPQFDRHAWPAMRTRFAARFAERTRKEWLEEFAGSDACVFPVHSLRDAAKDRHLAARHTLVEGHRGVEPAAAPRFSRTPAARGGESPAHAPDSHEILAELGCTADEIAMLERDGIVARGTGIG